MRCWKRRESWFVKINYRLWANTVVKKIFQMLMYIYRDTRAVLRFWRWYSQNIISNSCLEYLRIFTSRFRKFNGGLDPSPEFFTDSEIMFSIRDKIGTIEKNNFKNLKTLKFRKLLNCSLENSGISWSSFDISRNSIRIQIGTQNLHDFQIFVITLCIFSIWDKYQENNLENFL